MTTTTCSNCGAAVRPGAKFCTACGTRLNDVSTSAAAPEWTATQPVIDPSAEATGTGTITAEPEPPAAPAAGTVPASEATPAWSWRSSPTATEEDEASAEAVAETPGDEPRVFHVDRSDAAETASPDRSAETFTWSWGTTGESEERPEDGQPSTGDRDGEAAPADLTQEAADTLPAESDANAQEDGDDLATEFWSSEEAPDTDDASQPEADTARDAFRMTAADTVDTGDANDATADQLDVSPAASGDTGRPSGEVGDEDPMERARRLIEEALTLIPATSVPPEPVSSAASDFADVRERLDAARATGDFSDVRATLESARARPRDVDTMLDLVDRIDRMLEALDDRDRLAAAVDEAIARLGPDSPSA